MSFNRVTKQMSLSYTILDEVSPEAVTNVYLPTGIHYGNGYRVSTTPGLPAIPWRSHWPVLARTTNSKIVTTTRGRRELECHHRSGGLGGAGIHPRHRTAVRG